MNTEYTLSHEDYLIFQLYTASKSKHIKQKRFNTRFIVSVLYLALGLMLIYLGNIIAGLAFVGFSVLWHLFIPVYLKKRYLKHYSNYIRENYYNRFDLPIYVRFDREIIFTKDRTGESNINSSELVEINEISHHYFLKFKTGESLILPKKKISNPDEVKTALADLVNQWNIKHNVETEWKWW
jgi:hypothetical protein